MKYKVNWGTSIFFVIISMLVFMAVLIYISSRQNIDLVEDNYYEKSIDYQKHIEKVKNVASLKQKIQFTDSSGGLELVFPPEFINSKIIGNIYLYSPVKKENDFTVSISTDSALTQFIPYNLLKSGRYTVKVDWVVEERGYYQETKIQVK